MEGGCLPPPRYALRQGSVGTIPSCGGFLRNEQFGGNATGEACRIDQALVGRGRKAQRTAARRSLPRTFRGERGSSTRRAQALRVSRRNGPPSNRGRARCPQP